MATTERTAAPAHPRMVNVGLSPGGRGPALFFAGEGADARLVAVHVESALAMRGWFADELDYPTCQRIRMLCGEYTEWSYASEQELCARVVDLIAEAGR